MVCRISLDSKKGLFKTSGINNNGQRFGAGMTKLTTRLVKQQQAWFARTFVSELINNSPVLTGRLHASWFATLDKPATLSMAPPFTRVVNSIHADFWSQVSGIKGYGKSAGPKQKIYVSNPLSYAWKQNVDGRNAGYIEKSFNNVVAMSWLAIKDSGDPETGKKVVFRIDG